jgi:hypothetical protein
MAVFQKNIAVRWASTAAAFPPLKGGMERLRQCIVCPEVDGKRRRFASRLQLWRINMFTRARKIATATLAAVAVTGAVAASTSPAWAVHQHNSFPHNYSPYHRYWYPHHYYGWGVPGAVVGGLVGGAVAGALGGPYYDYYGYYGGPYYHPYW